MTWDEWPRPSHGAHESMQQVAKRPAPFPLTTAVAQLESGFADWRERLTRNLARRSDGPWEPLTWIHARTAPLADREP